MANITIPVLYKYFKQKKVGGCLDLTFAIFEEIIRAGHSLLFPLFALPLLQHLFSLSLLRYFSENCNTLLAILYRYFCFISVADCINFRAISSVNDPQH
jgi:hypothetical protein